MLAPPHAFAISAERLAYGAFAPVAKGRGLEFRVYETVELPPRTFQQGVLGGPVREPEAFNELVKELVGRLSGPIGRASLVVPDAWLRVSLVEMSELPKKAAERDEVLRWKLKRLVPFRVEELRLAAVEVSPLPGQEEPHRLLLGFGLETLLHQLEEAFEAAQVWPGRITSTSLSLLSALVEPEEDELSAVALVGDGGYTLVFARRGEPVLYRYKSAGTGPSLATDGTLIARDLRLTRTFLEEHFPESRLHRVILVASPELEPAWMEWLEAGLGTAVEPLSGWHLHRLREEDRQGLAGLSWREVAPLVGLVSQEVV